MGATSYQDHGVAPAAVLSDGIVTVPLWAVTSMSISEKYALPPIGSTSARAVVATHDDTITLAGLLLGPERFAWKVALESLADASRRGSALGAFTGGRFSGLILITAMTIRTDLQVETLSFTAAVARRDVLEVSLTLAYLPLPSALGKLLDVASIGVAALADWAGG